MIMAFSPITSWEIDGETVSDFIFLGSKITADGDCSQGIKRWLLLERKVMTNLDSILKCRDITLSTKDSSQGYGFSSGHVWMWELDCEEGCAPKNWCFCTVVLEKTLMLGGIGGRSRRGWQRRRWLDGITRLNGRESKWTPGVDDGQGGLACCDSWGCKELDTTEWLNWTELKIKSATVSTIFPSICHEVMGPDVMILVFLNVEF